MPQVKDQSLDLLAHSLISYHCSTTTSCGDGDRFLKTCSEQNFSLKLLICRLHFICILIETLYEKLFICPFQSTALANHYITNAVGGADKMTATDLLAMGNIAGGIHSDHIKEFSKDAFWYVDVGANGQA